MNATQLLQVEVADDYEILGELGRGAFSVVYKARNTRTRDVVALKEVTLSNGLSSTILREIALLKDLSHDNIIKLRDVLRRGFEMQLVFDFLDSDLRVYMDNTPNFTEDQSLIKSFLYQTLSGVKFCHSRSVLHRDLKPQNLLIDHQTRTVKLADFNLARVFRDPNQAFSHNIVTLWYRAPELLLGCTHYSTPIDIWSVGCIFAEMILGRSLFQASTEIELLFQIFGVLGTPNEENWPGVSELADFQPTFPQWRGIGLDAVLGESFVDELGKDLLKSMLKYEPSSRVTAHEALQHEYFADIRRLESCKRVRDEAVASTSNARNFRI
mmetsp:Transcript_24475/g.33737  ORF Transcript_24475/g.33737 Transcript_24475/m.33737 type:complete len:326 (+) Transcript_24475:157-1134(+)|eukprot:CAMPEP_0196592046 /NCGR_PEP_ID=MMETSP1081-20130531/71706_1 /TAXON_ID=36882 /ORGANISM="Pyramimonas amylifera, Strain CCMP720" /LENGTH=325 /DNA_ID=CAMNT_0041915617 /DNA_START=52 /DNA_END=1029 /DNA_ORIENTATION=-